MRVAVIARQIPSSTAWLSISRNGARICRILEGVKSSCVRLSYIILLMASRVISVKGVVLNVGRR